MHSLTCRFSYLRCAILTIAISGALSGGLGAQNGPRLSDTIGRKLGWFDSSPVASFRASDQESATVTPLEEVASSSTTSTERESWQPWDGFVTGLRGGFESFPRPIGSPLYFEDPFINTDLRPLFLYHEFPESSLLGGGDLAVLAVQARLALTERFQFIATADGRADLEAGALPEGEGWNDIAMGLKYALYTDHETLSIVSTGIRWRLSNGSREVFQGTEDEISLFVSGSRRFGEKLYMTAGVCGRITTHSGQGNDSINWDVNFSYELLKDFFPLIEYHGFHYLSNGDRIPGARDGLLDYGNLGAGDVRGSSAHWSTLGFRWNFKEGVCWGIGYGFALQPSSKNDIYDERFTTNLIFTF